MLQIQAMRDARDYLSTRDVLTQHSFFQKAMPYWNTVLMFGGMPA